MNKILIAAFLLAMPMFANAEEFRDPRPDGFGGGKQGGFMQNLTEEQKACIEQYGCPMREMKKPDGEFKPGEKPQMKEMSAEEKAAMAEYRECQKNAFESCGIQMPQWPESGDKGVQPRAVKQ